MIILLTSFVFSFVIFYILNKFIYRLYFLNKYKNIIELLNYFLDTSYTSIYNEQIVAFTSEGLNSIPKNELETIERNFIKFTLNLIGPELEYTLCRFFGNKRVLINNIVIFFRQKLEQDELAKIVRTNMIEGNNG